MARGFVGAHLVILEAWLAGELQGDVEELASMALDLFEAGGAWAQRNPPRRARILNRIPGRYLHTIARLKCRTGYLARHVRRR